MQTYKGSKINNEWQITVDNQPLKQRPDLTRLEGFHCGPGNKDGVWNLATAIAVNIFGDRVYKEATLFWIVMGIKNFLQSIKTDAWEYGELKFKEIGIKYMLNDAAWTLDGPQTEKAYSFAKQHGIKTNP